MSIQEPVLVFNIPLDYPDIETLRHVVLNRSEFLELARAASCRPDSWLTTADLKWYSWVLITFGDAADQLVGANLASLAKSRPQEPETPRWLAIIISILWFILGAVIAITLVLLVYLAAMSPLALWVNSAASLSQLPPAFGLGGLSGN